jgi:hypothetical protein
VTPNEKEHASMDDMISQDQSSSPPQQDQTARHVGSVVAFPPPSQPAGQRALRLFRLPDQDDREPARRSRRLFSKYAPRQWDLAVGVRVAGVAGDRIVQGAVVSAKADPWRAAVFRRPGFEGCWIQLDNGERVAANRLRPIQDVQAGKGTRAPNQQSTAEGKDSLSGAGIQKQLPFHQGHFFCFEPQGGSPHLQGREEVRWSHDEDEIREAIFRHQFANNRAGAKAYEALFFLSVEDGSDPTDDFMECFRNAGHRVRKVSQCACSPVDGVQDKETGEPGVILEVREITWITEDEAEVEGGHYRHGLSSSGNCYRVVREAGRWAVREEGNLWVS